MADQSEAIKKRYGNPYDVIKAFERAAADRGQASFSEDDLFMAKWVGLYTHRHEPGYFMLRTKQPNGFVTPEQLDVIAEITEKQNKGYADISTRQNFQLHWVHATQAADILKRLEAAGITTRGACGDVPRNVVGCPVAGVDKDELFDASPIAKAVSDFFLGNPEFSDLPRKYKIGILACNAWCCHPEIQCVSLTGATRSVAGQTELGFDLRVGGGLSTQPFLSQRLNVFVKPGETVEVIRRITEIWRDSPEYRQKRHHARFKYLIHDWGIAKFRQALQERMGRALEEAPADFQEPAEAYRDHIGVHAQKQAGLYYIGAPVLVGRITSAQMKRVADLARRYGDGKTIRLTVRQNLLLLNVPEANVEKALSGLADVGLSINAHPVRRSVVTCTGTEFCKLAITETKARSRQIVEHLERRVRLDEPLRLHITGCPNACAQYQVAHVGLMGSKTKVDGQIVDAYDILVGGRLGKDAVLNHAILRKVPATECAKRLEQLLLGFMKQRKSKEAFTTWAQRAGDGELVRLLTEGQEHPLADVEDVPVPKIPESDEPVF